MKLCVVHDTPPRGSAYAEVMEAGFGLVPDLVALPHAKRSLLPATSATCSVRAALPAVAVMALLRTLLG